VRTMAEVIREELRKGGYQMPGDTLPYETQANAIAAHLTAAGFGKLPECPSKNKVGRPCILRDRHMTQHQFDVNMRPE